MSSLFSSNPLPSYARDDFSLYQDQEEQTWEALDSLLENLPSVIVEAPAGCSEAMGALARFFQAEAAGLYLAPRPGQPMELVDHYQLPSQSPGRWELDMLARGYRREHSIIQSRILDVRAGPWAGAAQEAGWNEMLVYLLPHRMARLVLAFSDRAVRMGDAMIKAALRSLMTAISYRQAASQILVSRQQSQRLEYLIKAGLNYVGEGLLILGEDGRVMDCNLLAGQLLGYAPEEVLGLPVEGVLASRSNVQEMVGRVLAGSSAMEAHELILFQRHGEPLPVRLRIVPLTLPDSLTPFRVAVFFTDRQTEQMEAVEKDLRQKNAQLKRTISILAHELRNPLGSIKAGLEYLEIELPDQESIHQDIKTIQNEIHRMDRLLKDALLVARPSELQTNPHLITELLDDLLAVRAKLFDERGIRVNRKYRSDLPRISIDRPQLEQVFDNLILNAVHAMANGGYLTIETGLSTTPSGDLGKHSPVLEIKIGDSGPGIPPETLSRIFDPFFTTKKGGTGLGLAVARRIVGQHNGTIAAESWPGIGTIFLIKLPVEELHD